MNENISSDIRQSKENRFKLKLFGFGILGLSGIGIAFLSVLWIFFRSKINKKSKYTAVAIGLVVSLIFSFGIQAYIKGSNPEVKVAIQSIENKYLNGSVNVGMSWQKNYTNGQTISRNILTIQYNSRKRISGEKLLDIGRITCKALGNNLINYDSLVVVNNISPIHPLQIPFFTNSFSAHGPCERWVDDTEFMNMINQLF